MRETCKLTLHKKNTFTTPGNNTKNHIFSKLNNYAVCSYILVSGVLLRFINSYTHKSN